MARKKKLSRYNEGLSVSELKDGGCVVSSLQRANHKAASGESADHGRVSSNSFGCSKSVQSSGPPSGRSLRTPVIQIVPTDSENE